MNKKSRRLGLHPLYRISEPARRVYKMAQTLPLLPHARIQEGYNAILQYADDHNVLQAMALFLDYVQRVWIMGK